jgi:hypothetical protein
MTQPALSRLEAGGVVPTIPLLERIGAALYADFIVTLPPHAAELPATAAHIFESAELSSLSVPMLTRSLVWPFAQLVKSRSPNRNRAIYCALQLNN